MIEQRTVREMAAGAANSARLAAVVPSRPRSEPWNRGTQPVFRPADGAGTQERMKIRPGLPGSIGHGKNMFVNVRRG